MPRLDTEGGLWRGFEDLLIRRLTGLSGGDFLIVQGGDLPEGQYVQFLVKPDDGGLVAECAGPAEDGGTATYTSAQKHVLGSLGWGLPDRRAGWSNYRVIWAPPRGVPWTGANNIAREDVEDAASLVARTLHVSSVSSPRTLNFDEGNVASRAVLASQTDQQVPPS